MNTEFWKNRFFIVWTAIGIFILMYLGFWLLAKILPVFLIFFICVLLAYILEPMVNFFTNPLILEIPAEMKFFKYSIKLNKETKKIQITPKGLHRIPAIAVVYLIIFALTFLITSSILPNIHNEFYNFVDNIPTIMDQTEVGIDNFNNWLSPRLPESMKNIIPETLHNLSKDLENTLSKDNIVNGFKRGFSWLITIFSTAAFALLIPVITFYLLMDINLFKKSILLIIPKSRRDDIKKLLKEVDLSLGRYIRGQILICFCIGVSITVALLFLDIEYAFLIGFFSGVVEIIPYLGVLIGLIPAFFIALIYKGFWYAVLVLVVLESIHWLEGHVIVPAIMGKSVKLPLLFIILALLIGAELQGVLGMFLALPVCAVLRAVTQHYFDILSKTEEKIKE